MKIKTSDKSPQLGLIYFKCPGCQVLHMIPTAGKSAFRFNGDFEKPTISPSVLVQGFLNKSKSICNFTVTDGNIYFLPNSTHDRADQTVELPDME